MDIEIIAIGDELTSGRILNTTSSFAAKQLFEAGYEIYGMSTIGDTPEVIGEALKRSIERVDAVLVTGGLGSTDDDLTNEAVSRAFGLPTLPNLEILSIVRAHFAQITDAPVGQLEKLAWLPEGAEVFDPQSGMAGYQLIYEDKPIFFLPGVPHQMKALMVEHVLPRLATWHTHRHVSTFQRVFRIFNLPENEVNTRVSRLKLTNDVHIGYYPVFPEVHLSLLIRDTNPKTAKRLFDSSCRAIKTALGDHIYGYDRDTMSQIVGQALVKRGMTLAVAESCTGGLIAQKLTDMPGSSRYFLGGVTSYHNSMKTAFLDVPERLIEKEGAVSPEVAEAMAYGILEKTGADVTLSVTGIAGPGGGTLEKPVGTVYIAASTPHGDWVNAFQFKGSREQIRELSAQHSLDILRRYLLQDI
ncbi:CinA family nicotinamide mononucleotide deamidase-related protein [Desulfotalea psychrophila]|uniref:CinA-like protein n=1 Tax=Desulfotalea psychrophila (strain LSv54 / DSM 12343) TaxID=177439 RepID=CINAL_DESPS|nr:CinA family nicotinamide mononucleotide deamidase-related protein [Desulfotalea psychrophila]Q6AIZ4.1 RecName: Full=CinA-like protein [Desulfotalea psychrophila LSv54]CAG37686.1 related to competence-damage inducible protein (CinA) [Desulfotalea psychrophila LSv54]